MKGDKQVLGLFLDETLAANAIEALTSGTPWRLVDVHSPMPSEQILRALKTKKSKVGYFTLAGGITGFLTGMGLAIYTSLQWSLIVSGKPVVSLIPYFIVGFEFTVLFAVFGNILGILMQTNLPEFQSIKTYDPRCSSEHFGVLASCHEGQEEALAAFFKERGGEVRLM
jgi:Alternative complex III, ActD subunit